MTPDPYGVLGVPPTATDAELRSAYRKLVQRHHPDHNGGSAESARRFEEVQEAYAAVRKLRGRPASPAGAAAAGARAGSAGTAGGSGAPAPDLDARLAEMERELQGARAARERAVRDARRAQEQAARDAAAASRGPRPGRPTDEELGYYSTDDSFSKILDDVAEELTDRWSEARKSPAGHRLSDLIDDLAARLTGEGHEKRR